MCVLNNAIGKRHFLNSLIHFVFLRLYTTRKSDKYVFEILGNTNASVNKTDY